MLCRFFARKATTSRHSAHQEEVVHVGQSPQQRTSDNLVTEWGTSRDKLRFEPRHPRPGPSLQANVQKFAPREDEEECLIRLMASLRCMVRQKPFSEVQLQLRVKQLGGGW